MELLYVNYIFKFLKPNWAQKTDSLQHWFTLPSSSSASQSLLQVTVHQGKREYSNIQQWKEQSASYFWFATSKLGALVL